MTSSGATVGSIRVVVRFRGNATAAGNIASEGGVFGGRAVKAVRVNVSAVAAWVGVLPKLRAAGAFLS